MQNDDTDFTQADLEEYAERHTTPRPDFLYELYRETHLKTMYPRMMSGHLQGNFLKLVCQMFLPCRVLEIGTFTGYSTINLALGMPADGILHTIDSNPEVVEIGRKYFEKAGVAHKIVSHIGFAPDVIPELDEVFDLVFIDADKENYLKYYHLVFDKVRHGGIILADNALWDGKVLEGKNSTDKEALGIIEFNDFVQDDPRVENLLLPVRDGLMMIRKG